MAGNCRRIPTLPHTHNAFPQHAFTETVQWHRTEDPRQVGQTSHPHSQNCIFSLGPKAGPLLRVEKATLIPSCQSPGRELVVRGVVVRRVVVRGVGSRQVQHAPSGARCSSRLLLILWSAVPGIFCLVVGCTPCAIGQGGLGDFALGLAGQWFLEPQGAAPKGLNEHDFITGTVWQCGSPIHGITWDGLLRTRFPMLEPVLRSDGAPRNAAGCTCRTFVQQLPRATAAALPQFVGRGRKPTDPA